MLAKPPLPASTSASEPQPQAWHSGPCPPQSLARPPSQLLPAGHRWQSCKQERAGEAGECFSNHIANTAASLHHALAKARQRTPCWAQHSTHSPCTPKHYPPSAIQHPRKVTHYTKKRSHKPTRPGAAHFRQGAASVNHVHCALPGWPLPTSTNSPPNGACKPVPERGHDAGGAGQRKAISAPIVGNQAVL